MVTLKDKYYDFITRYGYMPLLDILKEKEKKKRIMKTISVNLKVPIYNTVLNVIVSDSVFKCFKYIGAEKEFEEDFLKEANAMFAATDEGYWVLTFAKKNICPGIIAHECFHATCAIMNSKGIKYSDKSEEAFAYLLHYLVKKVNTIFKKHNLI